MVVVLVLLWVFLFLEARILTPPIRDSWGLFFLLGTLSYFVRITSKVQSRLRVRGIHALLLHYLGLLRRTVDFLDATLMLDGQIQRLPRIMQPIHQAAESGNAAKVLAELDNDTDQDASGHWGWTALLYSSAEGHIDVTHLLLSHGANPDLGNIFGRTPLMFAARYGYRKIVSMLLASGANPNIQASDGRTALIDAAEAGNTAVLENLLLKRANPRLRDYRRFLRLKRSYKEFSPPIRPLPIPGGLRQG